ncbi:MAG: DUF4276 family protein [Hormoscilla sp.]
MVRLLVVVEGETEETFVREVLAPHLYNKGFLAVSAKLMGNARKRDRRGGIKGWPGVRAEIIRHLNTDRSLYVSTMVDYYALPGGENNPNAWPGRFQASCLDFDNKAQHIEAELQQDIAAQSTTNTERFIPYIIMHEFEGLLFSNCLQLARSIDREDLATKFQNIRDLYSSPEEINDSPETHPSQRIKTLMPEYEKPLHGNLAAIDIGLETFRTECPGFRRWLEKIESLI